MAFSESSSAFSTLFGFLGVMCAVGSIGSLILYFGGFAAPGLGWRDLAKTYPAGECPPEGGVVQGCGGSIGMSTYRASLVVTFAREGIHVASGSWPGPGRSHPPILLPWSGVKSTARRETRFTRHGVIKFQDGNRTMTLIVPGPGRLDPHTATGWNDFPG